MFSYAYHVGSSREGVICEVALSHREISDRTGWWSGTKMHMKHRDTYMWTMCVHSTSAWKEGSTCDTLYTSSSADSSMHAVALSMAAAQPPYSMRSREQRWLLADRQESAWCMRTVDIRMLVAHWRMDGRTGRQADRQTYRQTHLVRWRPVK